MKKRLLKRVFSAMLVASMVAGTLAGCGAGNETDSASVSAPAEDAAEESSAKESGAEESAAGEAASASEEQITIELFYSPWATTPHDGVDPYEQYLEEKYNCDFILTPATDFTNQLVTRAAADDMPDLILLGNTDLRNLYEQGVLLDDWTPYLENMPDTKANATDLAWKYLTQDGKIIACPALAGDQKFSFMIRKDWLDNLGLSMPTNDEEFLDVLRAFTFDDPDGNGQDDTYGFTAAGGGTSVGELANLLYLYSSPSYFITDSGEVTNAINEGTYLNYLQMARTIVEEGLIDPDWFTQGWDERKPNLYAGKYGVCWYPAMALVQEIIDATGSDEGIDQWAIMPMYSGALLPEPIVGALRTVSAKAAEDPAKMEIICSYLEEAAYPNEMFFVLREGYLCDGYDVLKEIGDGAYFLGVSSQEQADKRQRVDGSIMFGWGQVIQAQGQAYFTSLEGDEPTELNLAQAAYVSEWQSMDKWAADYRLLNLDPTLLEEANAAQSEFTLSYIMGDVTDADWESFVEEYNSLYGDALREEAAETFRSYGLLD